MPVRVPKPFGVMNGSIVTIGGPAMNRRRSRKARRHRAHYWKNTQFIEHAHVFVVDDQCSRQVRGEFVTLHQDRLDAQRAKDVAPIGSAPTITTSASFQPRPSGPRIGLIASRNCSRRFRVPIDQLGTSFSHCFAGERVSCRATASSPRSAKPASIRAASQSEPPLRQAPRCAPQACLWRCRDCPRGRRARARQARTPRRRS